MISPTSYVPDTSFKDRRRWTSVVMAAAVFLVMHWYYNISEFHHDARAYWGLASPSVFFNYPDVIRGYFYPALLLPLRYLGEVTETGIWPFRLFSSIAYGWLLAGVMPDFFEKQTGLVMGPVRRLIPSLLLATLMPGVILFPLTDLSALMMAFGSLVCVSYSFSSYRGKRFVLSSLAGILAYGAYNTRTIYAFFLVAIVAALFTQKGRIGRITAFALGLAITGAPQSAINAHWHQRWLPVVVSEMGDEAKTGARASLFAIQTLWGMGVQRYETNINRLSTPKASVWYMDLAGQMLIEQNVTDLKQFSLKEYLGIVVRHPLDFLGLMGRHFVNGLDVRDGEIYTRSLSEKKQTVSFINFCVVFLGFVFWARAASRASKPEISRFAIWVLPLLLPVFAILPGAIETRFFLPLHILLYAGIAFLPTRDDTVSLVKKKWAMMVASFVVAASLFNAVTTSTMASLQLTTPDMVKVFQPER